MSKTLNQENKSLIWGYWIALQNANAEQLYDVVDSVMSRDVRCFGPDPIDELQGSVALVDDYWSPLLRSFPGLTRQTHLFCGGKSNGRADGDISKDGRLWVMTRYHTVVLRKRSYETCGYCRVLHIEGGDNLLRCVKAAHVPT